jgi:hypothetical protein
VRAQLESVVPGSGAARQVDRAAATILTAAELCLDPVDDQAGRLERERSVDLLERVREAEEDQPAAAHHALAVPGRLGRRATDRRQHVEVARHLHRRGEQRDPSARAASSGT